MLNLTPNDRNFLTALRIQNEPEWAPRPCDVEEPIPFDAKAAEAMIQRHRDGETAARAEVAAQVHALFQELPLRRFHGISSQASSPRALLANEQMGGNCLNRCIRGFRVFYFTCAPAHLGWMIAGLLVGAVIWAWRG